MHHTWVRGCITRARWPGHHVSLTIIISKKRSLFTYIYLPVWTWLAWSCSLHPYPEDPMLQAWWCTACVWEIVAGPPPAKVRSSQVRFHLHPHHPWQPLWHSIHTCQGHWRGCAFSILFLVLTVETSKLNLSCDERCVQNHPLELHLPFMPLAHTLSPVKGSTFEMIRFV